MLELHSSFHFRQDHAALKVKKINTVHFFMELISSRYFEIRDQVRIPFYYPPCFTRSDFSWATRAASVRKPEAPWFGRACFCDEKITRFRLCGKRSGELSFQCETFDPVSSARHLDVKLLRSCFSDDVLIELVALYVVGCKDECLSQWDLRYFNEHFLVM